MIDVLPTRMRAWRVHELGEPEQVMSLDEVALPIVGPGESLIRVRAAGLNFPDLLACRGGYQERPPLPFTPGLEVAGEVVSGRLAGERVAAVASLPVGGLADYVVVADPDVYAVPSAMPDEKAAALLGTYLTGQVGLYRRAGLRAGESVLVHAGAGGVGSAAIQLAKAGEAQVIATAGGPAKTALCRELGADVVVDYTREDFVQVVKEVTGGRGADVVYDPVGGDVFDASRRCVAFEGRIVVVGFAGGRIADAPTNHALVKNYSVVGLHLGLYRQRDPAVLRAAFADLIDWWEAGLIDPLVGSRRPFAEVPTALRALGERGTVGKVVVTVEEGSP